MICVGFRLRCGLILWLLQLFGWRGFLWLLFVFGLYFVGVWGLFCCVLRVLIVLCMLVVLRLVVRLIFGLCLFMCLLLGGVVYCIRLFLVYFVCLLLGWFWVWLVGLLVLHLR